MKRFAAVAFVIAAVTLSFAATMTSASTRHSRRAVAHPARYMASTNGTMDVNFTVQRFVKVKNGLKAVGEAVATYTPSAGQVTTVTKRFSAKVLVGRSFMNAQRTCPVLLLQLDQLSLVLLGLHVDLDKVVLTITANSKGGVLGSLFCSLAHSRVKLLHAAGALTKVAQKSGLASNGLSFGVPVAKQSSQAWQSSSPQTPASCQVLDLILGPLHLNLLGLIVDLNKVHLSITADPNGGVLGSLFCSLTK